MSPLGSGSIHSLTLPLSLSLSLSLTHSLSLSLSLTLSLKDPVLTTSNIKSGLQAPSSAIEDYPVTIYYAAEVVPICILLRLIQQTHHHS